MVKQLDGLVDQVNREFHLKVRYMVGQTMSARRDSDGNRLPSMLLFGSVGDSFDPALIADHPHARAPREMSKDDLLACEIMVVDGQYVSVVDLIRHLAYVHGLVHPGEPKEAVDEQLLGWRRTLQLGGKPAGLREIRGVARVIHSGLVPLRDALLAKHQT